MQGFIVEDALQQKQLASGEIIFEELLCRWGVLEEIVTDNGYPFVVTLNYLGKKYGIHHIKILSYNSQANRVIERKHLNM